MVLLKEKSLRPPLRCFFSLGNKIAWLLDQVKSAHSTQEVLDELETVHSSPFLEIDPHYVQVVDALLEILRQYCELLPDEARAPLKQEVQNALGGIPPIYTESDNAHSPLATTDWFWIDDNGVGVAVRMIGDRYIILARDANTSEVQQPDNLESSIRITRNDTGWHCSAHANASEEKPCSEIKLVLDMTDGGKPVTEARVVVIRRSEDPPVKKLGRKKR